MADQARYEPLEESALFPDGTSARPLPAGVVARGTLRDESPIDVTRQVLERGRERYNIFCTPCHDYVGNGEGIAVLRGFRRRPPSLHVERLRDAPKEHFFDVITNGFGAMNDYAMQIPVRDRWAIIAYIRALQLSQNATVQGLDDVDRRELEKVTR
jgi:hypothetical protein